MIAIIGGLAANKCIVVIQNFQIGQTIVVILIGGDKQMIDLIVRDGRIAGHNPWEYLKAFEKSRYYMELQ